MSNIKFGEFEISQEFFDQKIATFAESFSYTSLSCEQAFKELKECENELDKLLSEDAKKYFETLQEEKKNQILAKVRFFIVYSADYSGMKLAETVNLNSQEWVDNIFKEKFLEMNSYLPYIVIFNENNFDEKETYRKVINFFRLYNLRKVAYQKAQNMKKNHIDAFYYALELDELNQQNIIELNAEVTKDQEDHEIGYKKVNNIIQGATFATTEKEKVPQAIEQLLYSYKNETICVKVYSDTESVHFSIQSTGMTLSKRECLTMFERCAEGPQRYTSVGNGIGLYLCKKIINSHKGQIFASTDGRNTNTFTFVLPQYRYNQSVSTPVAILA